MRFEEFKDTHHFQGLDFLRGMAVIMVIWHHTGASKSLGLPPLLAYGFHGVTLFFCISGFLITTLLLREIAEHETLHYKNFLIRRALRIFPLYYAVLLLYCIVVSLFESDLVAKQQFWGNLIYFATYTSNYFVELSEGRTIFYFSWSLAAEEQFYLVLPLLLLLFRLRMAYAIIFLLTISVFLVQFSISHTVEPHTLKPVIFGLSKVPFAICLGTLLAIGLHYRKSYRVLSKVVGTGPLLFYMVALFITLENHYEVDFLFPLLSTLLLACIVLSKHFFIKTIVNNQLMRHVGMVSYGMYLLHMLCANTIAKIALWMQIDMDSLSYFSFVLITTFIVAKISYQFFESYFLRLKQNYSATR